MPGRTVQDQGRWPRSAPARDDIGPIEDLGVGGPRGTGDGTRGRTRPGLPGLRQIPASMGNAEQVRELAVLFAVAGERDLASGYHAAAPWYSWISPPRMSRRRTSFGSTGEGGELGPCGTARPIPRCGLARL